MARPDPGSNLELDMLQSNYTIEIPLLDRAHAYQSVSQSNENLSLPDCLPFRLVHEFHGHCSPDGIYESDRHSYGAVCITERAGCH
jgi:hypothetical protein